MEDNNEAAPETNNSCPQRDRKVTNKAIESKQQVKKNKKSIGLVVNERISIFFVLVVYASNDGIERRILWEK